MRKDKKFIAALLVVAAAALGIELTPEEHEGLGTAIGAVVASIGVLAALSRALWLRVKTWDEIEGSPGTPGGPVSREKIAGGTIAAAQIAADAVTDVVSESEPTLARSPEDFAALDRAIRDVTGEDNSDA